MNNFTVLGIDLAKNVFQVCAKSKAGKSVFNKSFTRIKLIEFIAQQTPCIIGIEACGGSHYWARLFQRYGHEVRMMAPQFVKPYVKSNKTDRNDAAAIAEACTRGDMRFVAVKTVEQQDILSIHRVRELAIKQRTARSNQIRGLLNEYGITIPQGISKIRKLPIILDDANENLTSIAVNLLNSLYESFKTDDADVKKYDVQLELLAKQNETCRRIQKIPGVGPLTASAIVASVGDAKIYRNGREMSAWLGLTPKQHSSGGKIRLGGITKRGDCYLRKLLVQGARTVVMVCDEKKTDRLSCWTLSKKLSGGYNKAAIALANKNARMIWAVMAKGEAYRQPA